MNSMSHLYPCGPDRGKVENNKGGPNAALPALRGLAQVQVLASSSKPTSTLMTFSVPSVPEMLCNAYSAEN